MIRLGVNIDHVATLRNARGESYPNPVQFAALAELGGADNITCHLREDRRHIKDQDVQLLKQTINIPLNFEMAATDEMIDFALAIKPQAVTLVPERREELTTEGGLDVANQLPRLQEAMERFAKDGIFVALFVDPEPKMIQLTKELGAQAVELHTGALCHQLTDCRSEKEALERVAPFVEAAQRACELGLSVHVGHGLNYHNAWILKEIPHLEEANIGHSIVAKALAVGFVQAVSEMKALLERAGS